MPEVHLLPAPRLLDGSELSARAAGAARGRWGAGKLRRWIECARCACPRRPRQSSTWPRSPQVQLWPARLGAGEPEELRIHHLAGGREEEVTEAADEGEKGGYCCTQPQEGYGPRSGVGGVAKPLLESSVP